MAKATTAKKAKKAKTNTEKVSPITTEPSIEELASRAVTNRTEFFFSYYVIDGNPNGDPEAANAPRMDAETGHGLVSPMCMKRKWRDEIHVSHMLPDGTSQPGYDIYVKERDILNESHLAGYHAIGLNVEPNDKGKVIQPKLPKTEEPWMDRVCRWMCATFWDIATFGGMMQTKVPVRSVRGPVQTTWSVSLQPLGPTEHSITRVAVTTQEERDKGAEHMMGRTDAVRFALFTCRGYINPCLARKTGFSAELKEALFTAMDNTFERSRSAASGEMGVYKFIVFEHDSMLGNARAQELFDTISITPRDPAKPARSCADFEFEIDTDRIPSGVTVIDRSPANVPGLVTSAAE